MALSLKVPDKTCVRLSLGKAYCSANGCCYNLSYPCTNTLWVRTGQKALPQVSPLPLVFAILSFYSCPQGAYRFALVDALSQSGDSPLRWAGAGPRKGGPFHFEGRFPSEQG